MKPEQELTKEQIQERATFEVEDLDRSEKRIREHALEYAKRIVEEALQFNEMLESPKFDIGNLRKEQMTWIDQYSNQFKEHIAKADSMKDIKRDLRHTISLVKEIEVPTDADAEEALVREPEDED